MTRDPNIVDKEIVLFRVKWKQYTGELQGSRISMVIKSHGWYVKHLPWIGQPSSMVPIQMRHQQIARLHNHQLNQRSQSYMFH